MSQKTTTSNNNINKSEPLYIYCNKKQRIKLSPIYVRHNTSTDKVYYKLELLKQNDEGNLESVNDDTWNIYHERIEDLYQFIQTTTELQSKDLDTVVISQNSTERAKILSQLLNSDDLTELFQSGKLDKKSIKNLKNAIKITEIEHAIDEFKQLLISSPNKEKPFEEWCKENTWAYGNYYVLTEDVHTITNAEKVDALIKNTVNEFRDIVEFKKPSAKILEYDTTHKNYYFSEAASMAISQVVNYAELFDAVAENGLHRYENIKGYNPKSIIIIGRSNEFNPQMKKALHSLNSRLNNIQVMSYDMLLAQCENLLAQLKIPNNQDVFDDNNLPL